MWIAQNSWIFSNPQPNPQHAMSCTTSAYFGSLRIPDDADQRSGMMPITIPF